MRKLLLTVCIAFVCTCSLLAQSTTEGFNPTFKWKFLLHSRYEQSLTDSVDVNNKFNADPINTNFRIRRLEVRTDINFTDKLTGVIRLQLPDLKTATPGKAIELAYVNYKVKDAFQIRAGQFKNPYELDEQTSHEDLRMIDRGTTSKLFVDNNLASYQPGLMLWGNLLKDKTPLTYYLAVVNGSSRAVPYDDNGEKNVIGRLEFTPVKGVRLGVNAQSIGLNDETAGSYGADLQIIENLSAKTKLIVEGEYIQGLNTAAFLADTTLPEIADYTMGGYFGQALFKFNTDKKWCKVFEIGGKYEFTDPNMETDLNDFSTITGTVGVNFLPDNDARLQLNIVHTDFSTGLSSTIDASNMFVMQFQLKI